MKYKTIEEKIDAVYDDLFDWICEHDDNLYELKITYKGLSDGKTVERSWLERDRRLKEESK